MTSALQDNPGSETSDTEGKNKGQKRKRSTNFDSPLYEKRRSARVRNSQKVNIIYFSPDVTYSCKFVYNLICSCLYMYSVPVFRYFFKNSPYVKWSTWLWSWALGQQPKGCWFKPRCVHLMLCVVHSPPPCKIQISLNYIMYVFMLITI